MRFREKKHLLSRVVASRENQEKHQELAGSDGGSIREYFAILEKLSIPKIYNFVVIHS
jgi:hypothetical protein